MSYDYEDISELKKNLSVYPDINYMGDIDAREGEILSYWRPTIGSYDGFKQIDIKGDFLLIAEYASKLLWEKISCIATSDIELLVSVDSCKKWLNINVKKNVNIVDAFELYESEPEFVAIDIDRTFLFAVHTDCPSIYADKLLLFFFRIEKDQYGKEIFIKVE